MEDLKNGENKLAEESDRWIQAGGVTMTAADLLLALKVSSESNFLLFSLRVKVAAALAIQRGIQLSEDDLAAAEIDFFTARDLFDDQQILAWMKSMKLANEDLRNHLAEIALAELAASEFVTDAAVEDQFLASRHTFARAAIERFEFGTSGKAREFILAARENEIVPT